MAPQGDERARQGQESLGSVWVDFPDHAPAPCIERALGEKARV